MQRHVLTPAHAHAHLQAFEAIESPHPLVIHAPTVAAQQHPDAPTTEARPRVREIANAQPQRRLIARLARAIPRRATELREPTGPHATDLERHLKPLGELPTARGPQVFPQGLGEHVLVEREIGEVASAARFHPRAGAVGAPRSRPDARTSSSTRRTWLRSRRADARRRPPRCPHQLGAARTRSAPRRISTTSLVPSFPGWTAEAVTKL